MEFTDKVTLKIKAGDGGKGIVSWRKEKFVPEGGPDGGNGGKGGDVVILGNHNISDLSEFKNIKHVSGEDGKNGQPEKMTGKDGKDYIINVPLGTSIINEEGKIIEDILADNYRYIICNGGEGGKGNSCFKSAINHAPSLHENGDLGEEIKVTLKLRYIADVGLIGLPNAGKSTLISALTNAKPRIANYEFTTLTPVLGICEFNNQKITFADIPGLIEGASEGRGLGHEFLKHIERCHILLHIVSLSEIDNIDPYKSFKIIENELKLYSSSLIHKEIILVCNKMDCENGEERFNEFKKHFKNKKIFLISAKEKMGIDELKEYVFAKYENIKNLFKSETVEDTSVKIIEIKKRKEYEKDLEIKKIEDGVFEVNSNFIKYWRQKIPLDTKENIIRFNQKLDNMEVEKKIYDLGGKKGDTMILNGEEFNVD